MYTAQAGGVERGFGDAFPELGFSEATSGGMGKVRTLAAPQLGSRTSSGRT